MFGIIRPCTHRLAGDLADAWRAHLCGMCLALRDDHGQLARLATNYDGLIISVLAEAQAAPGSGPARRQAGPCLLRGMRRASVATGDCARLAATVSLVLAAAKARDHAADGDGVAGYPGLRQAAAALAGSWEERAASAGTALGFDTAVLTDAVSRQQALEAQAGPGTSVLTITSPTETATGAAFAHTAILAGRPGNQAALAEAGRLFGRIAHLLDAVEDLAQDEKTGAWNPLIATGTPVTEARRLCEDACAGIRLALADADFTDRRLVDVLLDSELRRAMRRVFGPQAGDRRCGYPGAQRPQSGGLRRAALGLAAMTGLLAATSSPPGPYDPGPRAPQDYPWPAQQGPGGQPAPASARMSHHRWRRSLRWCGDVCCQAGSFCCCEACCNAL